MKGILVKGMLALLAVGIMAAMMATPAMSADPVTSANVNNSAPFVCDKWEEPDYDNNSANGIQVMPNAAGVKVVTIKACVCDPNDPLYDIANVTAIVTGPAGNPVWNVVLNRDAAMDPECPICGCGLQCIGYSEAFNMDPDDPAGIYTVVVTVTDQAGATDTMENEFEYLSLIAMTAGDVAFGSLAPGENSTATSNVTCTGNVAIEFVDVAPTGYDNATATDGIEWSDMISGSNTIIDDQITTAWINGTVINRTNSAPVPFTLNVPSGIPAGAYTGTITFAPTEA